jgi:alpha-beta hydrolase superfamily lysophospholipase
MRGTLIAAAVAALLVGGAALWTGDALTRLAPATPNGPGLAAAPLAFSSESGARLAAWFVPGAPGGGAILLLHAVRSNKHAMLPRARFLNAQGFAVLAIDLQAHGESEGERITFGYREAADVRAAVAKLRALAPGERVGVVGVSLGGAALALASPRPAVDAAVLESVYPTVEDAVANRLAIRFGVLGPRLAPLLLVQLEPRLGFAAAELRPIERVAALGCPLLVVQGTADRHATMADARRLFEAAAEPKTFYAVEGAGHVDLHAHAGAASARHCGDFCARPPRRPAPADATGR